MGSASTAAVLDEFPEAVLAAPAFTGAGDEALAAAVSGEPPAEALAEAGFDPDKTYQEWTKRYLSKDGMPRAKADAAPVKPDPAIAAGLAELREQQQVLREQIDAQKKGEAQARQQAAVARETSELADFATADPVLVALAKAYEDTPETMGVALFQLRARHFNATIRIDSSGQIVKPGEILDTAKLRDILCQHARDDLARLERLKAALPAIDPPAVSAPAKSAAEPAPAEGSRTLSRRHASRTAQAKGLSHAERLEAARHKARA